MIGPVLIASKAVREEVSEYLKLAKDTRDFVRSLVALLTGRHYESARELLDTRIREQEAGRKAHEASRLAGPRRGA